jgi:hypothetical protein
MNFTAYLGLVLTAQLMHMPQLECEIIPSTLGQNKSLPSFVHLPKTMQAISSKKKCLPSFVHPPEIM